jgi:quercetin dioxygenase-like cupin family protein
MELNSAEDRVWEAAPAEHFTGAVWFGPLAPKPREDSLNALGVHFEAGARTDWHTHPDGQVLYVTDGAGFVQKDDGESVRISPGDVVYAPPGEVHWHGATAHSHMTHLSLTSHGATQWLPRKVTDDEYDTAAQAD